MGKRGSARETMVHRLEAAVRRHGVTVAPNVWLDDLDAIEAEAVTRDREALAAKVRALTAYRIDPDDDGTLEAHGAVELFRAAVLALLAATPSPDREAAFRNALSTEHELRQPDHDQTVPPPPVGQEGYCWSCELLAAP